MAFMEKVILLPNTKEPLFATAEQRKKGVTIYFDRDGMPACCNAAIRTNGKICIICGNMCISFIANEDLTYTCSACGKFPRELIQS
jgi:hypothetical protein